MQTSKEININKKFERILISLNVKDLYIANLRKAHPDTQYFLEELNKEHSFKKYIMESLYWDATPEGYDFWNNVAHRKSNIQL